MKKTVTTVLAAVLSLSLAAGAVSAQDAEADAAENSWIHVRVEKDGSENVNINLPVPMIDVALESGVGEELSGDLRIGPNGDITIEQLRGMWEELRDAEEADFVDVRDGDERVRVYKRAERVHVDVDEDGREKVRIDLPASIVDALLGAEDRLDIAAAARELARAGEEEIVRIDDEETRVRIWVDRDAGSSGG